ncbi:MAG TPA: DUF4382 domain-containing protein [Bacteroidota bacterium]|nr:DUF4382 domain-containing protein [Bacteroidota bacterium]
MKAIHIFLIVAIVSVGIFVGCEKSTAPLRTGELRMYLVDSPSRYDAVNIAVTRVEVHRADADTGSGWTVVSSAPALYDLLKLRNGASALLGGARLEAGEYTQIRLIIGQGSNVVVNGVTHPLTIPSGVQSGLKLVHQFTIEPEELYELTLDFDAERSIVVTGSNQYLLRPTIRVQANVISGSISGTVLPLTANAIVQTTVGTDTVTAYPDTTNGFFRLVAIPVGTYNVSIIPASPTYRDTTISGVAVTRGQNTLLGTITLQTQ